MTRVALAASSLIAFLTAHHFWQRKGLNVTRGESPSDLTMAVGSGAVGVGLAVAAAA